MSYLAVLGFTMMALITYLLMKDKINILVCFALIPVIFSFLSGSSWSDTEGYIGSGLEMTRDIFLMIMFSLPYFALISDAALFDMMVFKFLKRVKIKAPILCSLAAFVAVITTLDGSVMSSYLITIPLFLPLFKKLKIDTVILVFLCSVGIMLGAITPWNARILRAASLLPELDNGPMTLVTQLLPVWFIVFAGVLILGYFLGLGVQKRQLANGEECEEIDDSFTSEENYGELARPKLFWFNLILTILLVVTLSISSLPSYYIFAAGLIIALCVNYPDLKQQNELISEYASKTYPIAPIVLLSGVVVGILQGTGMMDAMVQVLVNIIPSSVGPYVHIIIALLSTPLMLLFTNDTWFFALVPIIAALAGEYGVPAEVVALTLFFNIGAFTSLIAQPQIIMACELGETDVRKFLRFSFFKFWGLSVAWTLAGVLLGIFI
ncbi:SLC13 family permease [Marinilactibacillus kalidii]|uniref:SLC13 family permease n=1 Tax=Marinilactibacillus kalidii TaxID=2820274 RepID=UPI001ABDFCAA|nr:SLC13 family permease [Marinilactibacillus kalidii]